jgi:hypothetical protein
MANTVLADVSEYAEKMGISKSSAISVLCQQALSAQKLIELLQVREAQDLSAT